jgi:hypothetical protein
VVLSLAGPVDALRDSALPLVSGPPTTVAARGDFRRAALAVLAVPAVGDGIAIHAGLLWLAAVILTLLLPSTVTSAGVVEPLGLELPSALGSVVIAVPVLERYDYHLPSMLPVGIGVVLLSAVVMVRAVHHTGARTAAVTAGVAGPLLRSSARFSGVPAVAITTAPRCRATLHRGRAGAARRGVNQDPLPGGQAGRLRHREP